MKTFQLILRYGLFLIFLIVFLHLSSEHALAQSESGDWRPIYDLVMKWVNFTILAAVLVKFAGPPIKNFLNDQKAQFAHAIQRIETEKIQTEEKVKEAAAAFEESLIRFTEIKERILVQGKQEKEKIIENAHLQSQLMLEGTKRKIDYRIREARNTIHNELIEKAISLAFEKLPAVITQEDNKKFIDLYLSHTPGP